jgi:hypothetical protein
VGWVGGRVGAVFDILFLLDSSLPPHCHLSLSLEESLYFSELLLIL